MVKRTDNTGRAERGLGLAVVGIAALGAVALYLQSRTSSRSDEPVVPPRPPQASWVDTYPERLRSADMDTLSDEFGQGNRTSTSYVAWRLAETGYAVSVESSAQTAQAWLAAARANGLTVTSQPRTGDVAILEPGPAGHAAYVEAVENGHVRLSQYNYAGRGEFSVIVLPVSFTQTYLRFGRKTQT